MKKIATLVLVAMLLSFILASCGTPTPPHEHAFASNWTADATGHWHGATCEHTTEKADFAAHTDTDDNGKCDTCLYTLFTRDTVTVNAPEGVTVSENLTAKTGTDLVFTASVSNKYLLFAGGAEFVEKTVDGDTATYKFKVTSVNEDSEVTLTKEKYVFVDEIATGEGVISELIANMTYGGEVTINFPKAGKFYVYSDVPEVEFNYMRVLEIEVEEAGEVTLNATIWTFEEIEELVYNYYIVEADTTIVIDEAATDYVLPSNMEVVLQYTTTEKGWYKISLESDDFEYLSYQGQTVYVSEAGAIIETPVSVYLDSSTEFAVGYNASWTVEKLAPIVVQAGDNNLTFKSNTDNLISFTAPEAGVYSFVLTLESNQFKYLDSYVDWDDTIVKYIASTNSTVYISKYLTAGETVEIFVSNTTKEYNAETFETTLVDCEITDTLTITNLNYVINTDSGTVTGMVDSDGVINSIFNTSDEDVTYYVNGGEGVLIGVDDGEGNITWVSNYDFVVGANSFVSFLLKSDVEEATEVAITAKAVVYEIYTSFGSNYVQNLIPGKTYTLVTYETLGQLKPYIFTWENENVSILVNGAPIESGEAFNYYPGYPITVVNNGTEECSISIEFTDPSDIGDLVIGNNSIKVSIINNFAQSIEINFAVGGTYVLTPAEGEENLVVWYNGEEATLPLEFTVEDGGTVAFGISTSANVMTETEDIVDFTIECKELPSNTPPEGEYNALFSNMPMMNFNFTPVEGKTYGTVEIADYNGGSYSGTYKYALNSLGGLSIWDAKNDPVPFFFGMDMGGNWNVQPPMFMMPMALEKVVETPDDTEPGVFNGTIVVGANAIPANYFGVPAVVNTAGDYVLSYADGETNGFILIEGEYGTETISMPYSFTVAEGESVTFIICTISGDDTVDVVLTKEDAEETPSNALVLGDNAVKVTVQNLYCAGVDMTFTATEAGTYVIKAADGEENAEVKNLNIDELIDLPYEFTLEAGQTVTFNICTSAIMTLTEDTIDLIIEKVA